MPLSLFPKAITALLFILLFCNCAKAEQEKTLTMCIDHYPPLQVVLPNGQATGENVELTKLFFNRLGYKLNFTADTPFKRCLHWLKEGLVDVMTGLLDSPQRHLDYHLFLYDDQTVKQFFVRKDYINITRFSDLEGLAIAVVRGSRQFEEFDNAPEGMFDKIYVNTLSAAFGMLAKERVDAVVCTDYYGRNVIKSHPEYMKKVKATDYKVTNGTKVYIALSKNSTFANQADVFKKTARLMYQSGEFREATQRFRSKHPEFY